MPWTFVEIMETETSGIFPDSNSRVPMIAATYPTLRIRTWPGAQRWDIASLMVS